MVYSEVLEPDTPGGSRPGCPLKNATNGVTPARRNAPPGFFVIAYSISCRNGMEGDRPVPPLRLERLGKPRLQELTQFGCSFELWDAVVRLRWLPLTALRGPSRRPAAFNGWLPTTSQVESRSNHQGRPTQMRQFTQQIRAAMAEQAEASKAAGTTDRRGRKENLTLGHLGGFDERPQ